LRLRDEILQTRSLDAPPFTAADFDRGQVAGSHQPVHLRPARRQLVGYVVKQ